MNSSELMTNFQEFCNKMQTAMEIINKKYLSDEQYNSSAKNDLLKEECEHMQNISGKFFEQIIKDPGKFVEKNIKFYSELNNITLSTIKDFTIPSENNEKHSTKDKRFKGESWGENVYFDFLKEVYLKYNDYARDIVESFEGDKYEKKYLNFWSKQLLDAMSPSNFLHLNPEVLKEAVNTNGISLVKGAENFLKDLENSKSAFNISTVPKDAFKLGRDLASTEGKVIFKNDIIELICYKPKKMTYATPILICPPWINKYYILDLGTGDSFVEWLVSMNYQVYLISWFNPKEKDSNVNFEDYMQQGIIDAVNYL